MEAFEPLGWVLVVAGAVEIVIGTALVAKVAKGEAQKRAIMAAMTLSGLAMMGAGVAMAMGVFSGTGG